MKYSTKLLTMMVFLGLTATSCKEDYFDLEAYRGMVRASFPVSDVDPDQTWQTIGSAKVNVSVNLKPDETYKVKIYEQNPLDKPELLTVLADGTVKSGGTFTSAISYGLNIEAVYVTLFDSNNYMTVYPQPIVDGKVELQIGGETAAARATRAGSITRAILPDHDFSADIPEKPTTSEMDDSNFKTNVNGIDAYSSVNGGYGYARGTAYIDETTTAVNIWGEWDGSKNTGGTLYVTGNCDFTGKQFSVAANTTIYLVQGAQLTIDGQFGAGSKVYMAKKSKLTFNNSVSEGGVSYYGKNSTIRANGDMVVNGGNEIFMEGGNFKVYGNLFQLQAATFYAHNTYVGIAKTMDVNHAWVNGSDRLGLFYQEGGTFKSTNNTKLVCNGGKYYTDVASSFSYIEANGTGVIVNKEGTMISSGDIRLTNGSSVLINDGTLQGNYLGTEGSSHFQNNGTTVINGETLVNSNDNAWVNNGEYTTTNFTYAAGSKGVINNCHLVVTELFKIYLGDVWPHDRSYTVTQGFRMDAGSSVETKDFMATGPMFINMGSNSVFKVKETAYMAITKDDYGIYGPETGEYAVFQAKDIVRGKNNDGNNIDENQGFVANYYGHLYVACDSHFGFGYSNVSQDQWEGHEQQSWDQPYYRLDAASGAMMTTFNGADVHVRDNGCGAQYEGEPQQTEAIEEQEQPFSLRYCFEDNFPQAGDYDFNDAVITVTPTINGTTVNLRVSLDAVGATKQIAAAMRIVGLRDNAVQSCTADITLNDGAMPSERIINSNDVMLSKGTGGKSDNIDDVVLNICNNAHWALGRRDNGLGSVLNWFLNTVERTNAYEYKLNDVDPYVINYTIQLYNEADAALFVQSNIDVFIAEGYNGGYWEVHTVPYKFDEVLFDHAGKNLRDIYGDDTMPWAVCVPGTFKYPIEWTSINEAYPYFADWARDHTSANDWFDHSINGLVYE